MKLTFITGNKEKFTHLSKILSSYGIELEQHKIDTPEIQSMDVCEIAEFSAKWAAKKLGHPCVVTDVGCYVDCLNGFPGPFVKFTNQLLTAEQLLALIGDNENRRVEFRECISFATPEGQTKSFVCAHKGELVKRVSGNKELLGKAAPFNEITIFAGCERVMADYSYQEMMDYFEKGHMHFHEFGKWFQKIGGISE